MEAAPGILHPRPPLATPERVDAARRSPRAAWVIVGGLTVSLVAATLNGEWLLSLQGNPSGGETRPLGVRLLVAVPALRALASPATGAVRFGNRARRLGEPRCITPRGVAAVVVGGALVTNVVQDVAARLMGRGATQTRARGGPGGA